MSILYNVKGVFHSARLKIFKNSIGKMEYLWYDMYRIQL